MFRVSEFAALAGVTVRALHYYDRLGLLKARRDSSGFRVYTRADLERLQAIVTLKYIGLPLAEIRSVLAGDRRDLARAFNTQLSALEEKKKRIETAIAALREAEATLRAGSMPDLKHVIEVIQMQQDHAWILQHFTDSARPRAQQLLASTSAAQWTELRAEWTHLSQEIIHASGSDPGSSESQALLRRWEALIRKTTTDDGDLVHGLKSVFADHANWPEPLANAVAPMLDEQVLAFIQRAVRARA